MGLLASVQMTTVAVMSVILNFGLQLLSQPDCLSCIFAVTFAVRHICSLACKIICCFVLPSTKLPVQSAEQQ